MMKKLVLVCCIFLSSCATVKEENISYSEKCSREVNKQDIIDCHWDAIFYKIRAKWYISTNGLTESDYPPLYNVKTKIFVNKDGSITDFKLLTTSERTKLDRSIIKGIKRSSPLPVPKEPYFSDGGFSEINYDFGQYDGADYKEY